MRFFLAKLRKGINQILYLTSLFMPTFFLFSCKTFLPTEYSFISLESSETSKRATFDVDSLIDDKKFDLYCSSFNREKKNILHLYAEISVEKGLDITNSRLADITANNIDIKLSDVFKTKRDQIFYIYLNYPILPDPVESLIKSTISKDISNNAQLLKHKKNNSYYDFVNEVYSKIKDEFIKAGVPSNRIQNIQIFIYDDGTNSINAFALPGDYILLSKELVKRAFVERKTKEKSKDKPKKRQVIDDLSKKK